MTTTTIDCFHLSFHVLIVFVRLIGVYIVWKTTIHVSDLKEMRKASEIFGPGNVTNMEPHQLVWYCPHDIEPNPHECSSFYVEDGKTKEWLCLDGPEYPNLFFGSQLNLAKIYFECRKQSFVDECEWSGRQYNEKKIVLFQFHHFFSWGMMEFLFFVLNEPRNLSRKSEYQWIMEDLRKWKFEFDAKKPKVVTAAETSTTTTTRKRCKSK